ncbi:MAG: N-acetylmuramoyl-L-alanine amidase [Acutalibacteraceae bacterium]|nr:N-acetylmuramoyl-L-alanine amidase [Acutalibacteraceae bacterium]
MKCIYMKLVGITISLTLLFVTLINLLNFTGFKSVNSVCNEENNIIIIDAGHGGEDGGAIALDKSYEKDYNLDIALKLEKILKLYGFTVVMTRTTDTMTCDDGLKTQRAKKVSDIRNRMKIIEQNSNNAIFISVHQNKFSDERQNGTQVFYSHNNAKSKILADAIQNSVVSNIQKDNKRVTKKSGTEIYLLYHSQIPSVLVECGFLSNIEDLTLLKNEEYRFKLAMLIADGTINYVYKR